MRFCIFTIILFLLTTASCTHLERIVRMMSPNELNKYELSKLPCKITPVYGFRVGMMGDVPGQMDEVLGNIDNQFTEFSECFHIGDCGENARRYMIVVVDGIFRCEYHDSICSGEYDRNYGLIIVSYKTLSRRGILPALKHEWAHIYGIVSDDHQNMEEFEKCTGLFTPGLCPAASRGEPYAGFPKGRQAGKGLKKPKGEAVTAQRGLPTNSSPESAEPLENRRRVLAAPMSIVLPEKRLKQERQERHRNDRFVDFSPALFHNTLQ